MPKQVVIEMTKKYPFGELEESVDGKTMIRVMKTLYFKETEQYEMIKDMIHFIKVINHKYMVNLDYSLQEGSSIHLYYQYCPLRLEKWVVDVNEDISLNLEQQMIELAEYLTKANIKFQFDPQAIGLNHQMDIKYFLNQFSIALENQQKNYETVKDQIHLFFENLRNKSGIKQDIDDQIKGKRYESMSTNASISPLDEPIALNENYEQDQQKKQASKFQSKGTKLSQKVQSSKKKSMEVLLKFKKMSLNSKQ